MNLFNEYGEIGKGREIAMFWESSIEDFIKFCLSLFLHLGIADHRQEKSSNRRSSSICSRWSIAPLTGKRT